MAAAINEFFGAKQPDPVDAGMESMGFTKAEQPEPRRRTAITGRCPVCEALVPVYETCCGISPEPVRVAVEEDKP